MSSIDYEVLLGNAPARSASLDGPLASASTPGYWYLASPYSKYPAGPEQAFRDISAQAGLLISAKVPVFCPIAHSHPIALWGNIPLESHEIWLPADKPLIDMAKGIIVCMLDGWWASYGVSWEIKEFLLAGKPVIYMEPGTIPEGVL